MTGQLNQRHSQGSDLQQDDLRNAPEPGLAINTVNGCYFSWVDGERLFEWSRPAKR